MTSASGNQSRIHIVTDKVSRAILSHELQGRFITPGCKTPFRLKRSDREHSAINDFSMVPVLLGQLSQEA
jgi:hypothetical protein